MEEQADSLYDFLYFRAKGARKGASGDMKLAYRTMLQQRHERALLLRSTFRVV